MWDRPALVTTALDALDVGGSLTVVAEHHPRTLAASLDRIRPRQALWRYRHVGSGEWLGEMTRVDGDSAEPSALERLRRIRPFAHVDRAVLQHIIDAMDEHEERKGHVVVRENELLSGVGVVWSGSLARSCSGINRDRLLYEYLPFEMFGIVEFFDRGRTMGRIAVISKTARYALIPSRVLRLVSQRNHTLLAALGEVCAQRARLLTDALNAQVSLPIIARVANALLPYAASERGLHAVLAPLPSMTQSQIAAAAGTVKEVAARAIADLEGREALKRERGRIRYLDREKLVEVLNPS